MLPMLFCSNLVQKSHFSEIHLVCEGQTHPLINMRERILKTDVINDRNEPDSQSSKSGSRGLTYDGEKRPEGSMMNAINFSHTLLEYQPRNDPL